MFLWGIWCINLAPWLTVFRYIKKIVSQTLFPQIGKSGEILHAGLPPHLQFPLWYESLSISLTPLLLRQLLTFCMIFFCTLAFFFPYGLDTLWLHFHRKKWKRYVKEDLTACAAACNRSELRSRILFLHSFNFSLDNKEEKVELEEVLDKLQSWAMKVLGCGAITKYTSKVSKINIW